MNKETPDIPSENPPVLLQPKTNKQLPIMLMRFWERYQKKQRFVVFDVETVGGHPGPTIVEIGAIEAGLTFSKEYRTFQKVLQFRPTSWHPYRFELKIHKIPPKEIENGEDRKLVLQQFLEFIQGSTLICHTSFDINAMSKNLQMFPELHYALDWPVWKEFIDSCKLARYICPSLESFSLSYLAEYFQVKNPQAHRALADAYTTKRVIGKLIQNFSNNL